MFNRGFITPGEPVLDETVGRDHGIAPFRPGLDLLDEPRTFAPRGLFLFIWVGTAIVSLAGLVISAISGIVPWIWIVTLAVSLRQLWVTRHVQVDAEGIRTRNLFGRGRAIDWSEVDEVEDREVPLRSGRFFGILKIRGIAAAGPGRPTVIELDSDIRGFEVLRDIVREMSRKEEE